MNVIWSRYIVWMVGIGLVGMTAYAAEEPVQPAAEIASPATEAAKPTVETAKPAVEVNKQSGSIVPTLTVNQPSGKPIFTLKPYGYVKLDASYDTTRVQIGDYALYVLPKINGERDNEFIMNSI